MKGLNHLHPICFNSSKLRILGLKQHDLLNKNTVQHYTHIFLYIILSIYLYMCSCKLYSYIDSPKKVNIVIHPIFLQDIETLRWARPLCKGG